MSDGAVRLLSGKIFAWWGKPNKIWQFRSALCVFWRKLDVGEMLRADLETESLVRWGNQRKCWGTFLILFILYLLLAFIFPVFLKVDLFSSIKHTSSSSPNIPWPRILFPSLLSCPCGRSMPCAAGPGAAGKEAEDAGGFGASPSLHGYSTGGVFLPPSFFIGHYPPGKLKAGKKLLALESSWKCRFWSQLQGWLVVLQVSRCFAFHHPIFTGSLQRLDRMPLWGRGTGRPHQRGEALCPSRACGGAPSSSKRCLAFVVGPEKGVGWSLCHKVVSFSISPARTEYQNHQDVDTLSFCLLSKFVLCTIRSWIAWNLLGAQS